MSQTQKRTPFALACRRRGVALPRPSPSASGARARPRQTPPGDPGTGHGEVSLTRTPEVTRRDRHTHLLVRVTPGARQVSDQATAQDGGASGGKRRARVDPRGPGHPTSCPRAGQRRPVGVEDSLGSAHCPGVRGACSSHEAQTTQGAGGGNAHRGTARLGPRPPRPRPDGSACVAAPGDGRSLRAEVAPSTSSSQAWRWCLEPP